MGPSSVDQSRGELAWGLAAAFWEPGKASGEGGVGQVLPRWRWTSPPPLDVARNVRSGTPPNT